ncbi:hypothetical protein Tco_0785855 [Tanacetum coccineum]
MSTLVFVDPDISTQADGAQSSRVPVPLLEDPYETPESPHTKASPTSLPDSTPPTCHVEESEDSDTSGARSMSSDSTAPLSPDHPLTHTAPALVPILPEVAAMSDSTFCKRFRSSYKSSPSLSPPDLPSRKRYRGTSKLVEDEEEEEEDDEEEDDDEEEEEIEERSDSDRGDEAVPEGQHWAAPVMETAMGEGLRNRVYESLLRWNRLGRLDHGLTEF